jgi:hypothetical protein
MKTATQTAIPYGQVINPDLGLSIDHDFGGIQLLSKKFLCAVAQGKVDVKALMEYELAGRGYDAQGNWVGLSPKTNPVLAKFAHQA